MPRLRTVVVKSLYWLAVLVISLALLVLLVLFFESRDNSNLDERDSSGAEAPALAALDRCVPAPDELREDDQALRRTV